jgi:hypothetical protein
VLALIEKPDQACYEYKSAGDYVLDQNKPLPHSTYCVDETIMVVAAPYSAPTVVPFMPLDDALHRVGRCGSSPTKHYTRISNLTCVGLIWIDACVAERHVHGALEIRSTSGLRRSERSTALFLSLFAQQDTCRRRPMCASVCPASLVDKVILWMCCSLTTLDCSAGRGRAGWLSDVMCSVYTTRRH